MTVAQVLIDGIGRKAVAASHRLVIDEECGDGLDVEGEASLTESVPGPLTSSAAFHYHP